MDGMKDWITTNIQAYWHAYWPWVVVFGAGFIAGAWFL